MASKKKVKVAAEQAVESIKTKVVRLKKKAKAAADGPAKRKATKAVKRAQRRRRAVASTMAKPAAAAT